MGNSRVLIIDDDQDIREAFQIILESKSYEVSTATDKAEGMQKIKTDNPDLIILDVMMDTCQDGFEMARELKKDSEFKDIPILMLTSVQDKTGIEFKSTAGDPNWLPVEGFLDKPVDPQTLLDEIEKLLP